MGTFILVYAIASAATVYSDSGQIGVIGIGLVHALVLTAIIYAIGYRSGAKVNPAVTVGLLVAGKIGGGGLERPLAVRFSPDGAELYIVDFGVATQNKKGTKPKPETGVIWRVVREGGAK